MKHEPRIDRAQLLAAARQAYGLPFVRLEFLPVGYASASYIARAHGNRAYVLKLWPDIHTRRQAVARLPLLRRLHALDLGFRVPQPLDTTDGSLWAAFDEMPFAVFPLIEGHIPTPWAEWTDTWRAEYARLFATLHATTPLLGDVLPPRETFDLPFEPSLLHALERIEALGSQRREGPRRLRSLLLSRRNEVFEQLARLKDLRDVVRVLPGPRVLCHTDLGLENLLIGDNGRLVVLDWDEATVAPPEHDLHEPARLSGFGRMLHMYYRSGGEGPLYLEHFAFYLLRRYLNDATVRILRIVERNTSSEEDENDLLGIEMWGFSSWRRLDQVLGCIGRALTSQS